MHQACLAGVIWTAFAPSVWTPPVPPAPVPATAAPPRQGRPEILYVNFEGAVLQPGCDNDARYDCSTLANRFNGYVAPFAGTQAQRVSILQATRVAVGDFGIRVVGRRPPDDVAYTMVMYGDLGPQTFAGLAPYVDCEDLHPNDTSFTQGYRSASTGSSVILQEAAHTWGLEHVDSPFAILNPFTTDNTQRFQDECLPIVANTALEPTPGICNEVHTLFCDPGYQNSYQEMLYLFGEHVPDVEPPTLELTYPENGSVFVAPTSFALQGIIDDDLDPQYYRIEVYSDDALLFEDEADIIELRIQTPPPGEYDLRVVVRDQGGNEGEDHVTFTVLEEGSEHPLAADRDVPASSCGIAVRPGASGWGLWMPVFALARPRRRKSAAR